MPGLITKHLFLLLIIIPLSFANVKGENLKNRIFGHVTISGVTSIYDADTFRANIKEWPGVIGYRISIRVAGVDAPEIRGKCEKEKAQARLAKQYTVRFLRESNVIQLRNIRRGKYFRIIADVYGDGKSLSLGLLEAGLVREYYGGKRLGWCGSG